jgi:hypothetical protein
VGTTGAIEEFAAAFRQEHRAIRDAILDLIEAAHRGDRAEARRLVGELARLAGPHFRYEEEGLYPALAGLLGPERVEALCNEHDAAIHTAQALSALVEGERFGAIERGLVETLARGLLSHVSDREGLSIMVERLPEDEVAGILAARRRAWRDDVGLLAWAEALRARPPAPAA